MNNKETFVKCETCGGLFSPAFLDQVAEHLHDKNIKIDAIIKGKKVIHHARDVYPYCCGEFASGVHIYLKGEECPERPCDDDFIQGWICAERDLKDNYKLEF